MSAEQGMLRPRLPVALPAVALAAIVSGSPLAAQINAPAGRALFNEGLLIRSLFRYEHLAGGDGGAGPRRLRNSLEIAWGARPHLSLSLAVPSAWSREEGASTTGIGDVLVVARYDLLRRIVPRGYTRLAPEVGLKLPTGGAFGSSSTDVVAGLVGSRVRDPDWWIAGVRLAFPGAGDRIRMDLAYLRRIVPRDRPGTPMILAVMELYGELVDGSPGGEQAFLAPGVEWILGRHLVLEASVPLPVVDRPRGGRPETGESVVLGVRWLF